MFSIVIQEYSVEVAFHKFITCIWWIYVLQLTFIDNCHVEVAYLKKYVQTRDNFGNWLAIWFWWCAKVCIITVLSTLDTLGKYPPTIDDEIRGGMNSLQVYTHIFATWYFFIDYYEQFHFWEYRLLQCIKIYLVMGNRN